MEVESRGNLQFVLDMARLLGLSETGEASDKEEALLRLLTPVCKLYTAKVAVAVASEGLEAFGGHGYVYI
jgi:alkylation response protein AidB-like acyl-CoA dehydrogenase